MTRPEILQQRGQLALAKKKLEEQSLDALGQITLIRVLLNPFEDDVSKLEVPKAAEAMKRLSTAHAEICRLKKLVAEMESDLDG